MPDIVIAQIKPSPKPSLKTSSAPTATKNTMKKAATGESEEIIQASSQVQTQKTAPDKPDEPQIQFKDLLMAQLNTPADQVVLPEMPVSQQATDVCQQPQVTTDTAVIAVQTPVQPNIQVLIPQSVTNSASQLSPAPQQALLNTDQSQSQTPQVQNLPATPKPEALPQSQETSPSQIIEPKSDSTQTQFEQNQIAPNTRPQVAVETVPQAAPQIASQTSQTNSSPLRQQSDKNTSEKVNQAIQTIKPQTQATASDIPASRPTARHTVSILRTITLNEHLSDSAKPQNAGSTNILNPSQAGILSIRQEFPASPAQITLPQQPAPAQPALENSTHFRLLANQVADGLRAAIGSERTVTIALNPPELGRVFVRLQDDNGSVSAMLRVENPATRADIEQSLPSIIRSIEQSGTQVRRIDVLPSDPIPQEGSFARNYDMAGGMPNQRDHSTGSSSQSESSGRNSWNDPQITDAAPAPASTISDSAISIYV